jgi:hypothetical protein
MPPSKFYPARPLALAVIAAASLLNRLQATRPTPPRGPLRHRGSVNVVEWPDEYQQGIDGVDFVCLMPLMTVDDIDEAARKTPSYRAPGQ